MRVVLPLVILLGVAACSGEPDAAVNADRKAPAASVAAHAVDDTVAAVVQSPASPAIALRFAYEGKPVVGKSSQLRLDFSGAPGSLSLLLQGEGLVLDPSATTVTLPTDGTPASQSFTVTPRAAGISEIVVRIQQTGDAAQEIVYAIPMLVESATAK